MSRKHLVDVTFLSELGVRKSGEEYNLCAMCTRLGSLWGTRPGGGIETWKQCGIAAETIGYVWIRFRIRILRGAWYVARDVAREMRLRDTEVTTYMV